MATFLIRFAYTSSTVKSMIGHSEINTAEQASAMIASLGGKMIGYWFSYGDFDGLVILEAPNNNIATAIGMAIRASGNVAKLETTVLIGMEEAKASLELASTANHLPPQK